MRLSTQIKPISYLKAHAAEIVRELGKDAEPLVITQNGEAKVIMQSLQEYERTQETLAMLKIMALGRKDVEDGNVESAKDFFARLREERNFSQ